MVKIIAIGGEPATGKTTLVKSILMRFKPLKKFKYGLVQGLYNEHLKLYIIGVYDGSIFSGTDKLSMAVQPDFIKLIGKLEGCTILFEGDRLFNQSLFDKHECEIIVLNVDPSVVEARHKKRNDNQSVKFIKAKQTKIKNITDNNNVILMNNNTDKENKALVEYITELILKNSEETEKNGE